MTLSQLVSAYSDAVTSLPSTTRSMIAPVSCATTNGCRKRPGLTVLRFRTILLRDRTTWIGGTRDAPHPRSARSVAFAVRDRDREHRLATLRQCSRRLLPLRRELR